MNTVLPTLLGMALLMNEYGTSQATRHGIINGMNTVLSKLPGMALLME